MSRGLREPLALALGVYALAVAIALTAAFFLAHGAFVFPLDDAYIHFAIARTLADSHVYGLQPSAFATPASSLLWPLILAGFRVVGVPLEGAALAVSVGAGALSLALFDDVLREEAPSMTRARRGLLLVAFAWLVPLVPMALLGMEHALHIVVVLFLVRAALREPGAFRLGGLAALAVGLRYESVFVVAACIGLRLASRAERRATMALAAGAVLPVLVAAAFFVAHGAPPFPASVVLKRTHAPLSELPAVLVRRAIEQPHVPMLIAAGIAGAVAGRAHARAWCVVGVLALLGQATFAQLGWFYRYESYAVAVTLIGVTLAAIYSRKWLQIATVVALAPLMVRAAFAHSALPRASRNVAEQQRQVGLFVRELPAEAKRAVAVNDVGAVAYFGQAKVLDLLGLADLRVARARGMRIDRPLSQADLERLVQDDGVTLAVLYPQWFEGVIPREWVPLERWRIDDNRVCAFDSVVFYAVSPAEVPVLRASLDAFRSRLPARVHATSLASPARDEREGGSPAIQQRTGPLP